MMGLAGATPMRCERRISQQSPSGRAHGAPSARCAVSLSLFRSPVKVSLCGPEGAGLMAERS